MTVSITATPVKRMDRMGMASIGAQLRMDGEIYVYMTKEVAAQWLPIIQQIADEQ